MKRSLFITALLAGVLFFGCSRDNSIVDPASPVTQTQGHLISLPVSTSGLSSEATNTFTFNVNGWEGAYQTMYLNFAGTNATVSANYTFPKNVFTGQKTIVITFNNDKASAEYTPSPITFSSPVIANIKYTGLNLASVNPANVKFVCLPPSGAFEVIQCERIDVDKTTGVINIVNAKINHFSKYGFID